MKIKQVCAITGLTDRTVRYYIEERLIFPEVAEIRSMLLRPDEIMTSVKALTERKQALISAEQPYYLTLDW